MTFQVPQPLKAEHEELHVQLEAAVKLPGAMGTAARRVADLLDPHFRKEEEFALPPLRLLPEVAAGRITPDMAAVLPLTDRLARELPAMLAEHQAIKAALAQLEAIARHEGNALVAEFARKLMLHARSEEEITYPAAILVGEVVRARLAQLQVGT